MTVHGLTFYRGALSAALMAGLALLGSSVAAPPLKALSLINDDEIEDLLRDYSRPILKASGQAKGKVQMRIVNDPSFNAFVLDGNNVFIHTGVLMKSDRPNQVIGVIAHEVGHIDGAHIAALRSEMQRLQTGMILSRIVGIAAAVLSRNSAAVMAGDDPWIKTFLSRRRQHEAAADQAGLRFLTATGQSGRGMLETFERMALDNRAFGINPYLLSHPTERTRIARLRNAVQRSPYYSRQDPPSLQLRHDLVRAKLRGFTMPAQDALRLYPAHDQSLPALYARAIALNCSGKCARNVGAIDALIKRSPKNPYFWELKGHVYTRAGRFEKALPPLRQALKLTRNRSHLIRLELGRAIVRTGDRARYKEAIRYLEVSVATQPENIGAYPIMAQAYAAIGRTPDADLAMARYHLARGNIRQAVIFAKRAKRGLKRGSRAWLKSDDIIQLAPRPN